MKSNMKNTVSKSHSPFPALRIVRISLFTAIALTIFILESYLPPLVPIPGVKLGLSNIITLTVLLLMKPLDAFIVLILRILLGTLFTGQAVSLLYSATGGLCCYVIMYLTSRFLQNHYPVLISILGAFAHNAGQLLIASIITQTGAVFAYFPVLMISAASTGALTGLTVMLCLPHLQKYPSHKRKDFSHD